MIDELETPSGTFIGDTRVYVTASGSQIDAILRCPDRATFDAVALLVGLTYEETQTVVIDEETGETEEQKTGNILVAKGLEIDHLGPVTITPGIYDDEGNPITAPVTDPRHHVNFRLTPPASEQLDENGNPRWHEWALAWSLNGTDDPTINAAEQAKVLHDIALIDPLSIKTPSRVFL
jgi:hypothetical protein